MKPLEWNDLLEQIGKMVWIVTQGDLQCPRNIATDGYWTICNEDLLSYENEYGDSWIAYLEKENDMNYLLTIEEEFRTKRSFLLNRDVTSIDLQAIEDAQHPDDITEALSGYTILETFGEFGDVSSGDYNVSIESCEETDQKPEEEEERYERTYPFSSLLQLMDWFQPVGLSRKNFDPKLAYLFSYDCFTEEVILAVCHRESGEPQGLVKLPRGNYGSDWVCSPVETEQKWDFYMRTVREAVTEILKLASHWQTERLLHTRHDDLIEEKQRFWQQVAVIFTAKQLSDMVSMFAWDCACYANPLLRNVQPAGFNAE